VQVTYDPAQVTYERLLDVFWRQIDPTDHGGQFVDRGKQYRSVVFVHDEAQRAAAEGSKSALAASGRFDEPLVTPVVSFTTFYPAEEYHQDYYEKNPLRYRFYRRGSGRDQFLEKIWGADVRAASEAAPAAKTAGAWSKPSDEELRRTLTPLQYEVTQREGTERAFQNEYWQEKRDGIYVDVVSGEPLFSSRDKFDSGTGWPSFTRRWRRRWWSSRGPSLFGANRSAQSGRHHLGHVFADARPHGPAVLHEQAALRSCRRSIRAAGPGTLALRRLTPGRFLTRRDRRCRSPGARSCYAGRR
jgi:peptide methionine sulfoxide reductase msrA/msrB